MEATCCGSGSSDMCMGDGRLQCVWIVWVVSAWSLLQTYFECQELKDKPAPDFDERLTMNEIWKAGEGARANETSMSIKFGTSIPLTFGIIWRSEQWDHLCDVQTCTPYGALGGDEEDGGWLEGGGLKFHTTADKAFSMAKQRFKEGGAGWKPLQDFVEFFFK